MTVVTIYPVLFKYKRRYRCTDCRQSKSQLAIHSTKQQHTNLSTELFLSYSYRSNSWPVLYTGYAHVSRTFPREAGVVRMRQVRSTNWRL